MWLLIKHIRTFTTWSYHVGKTSLSPPQNLLFLTRSVGWLHTQMSGMTGQLEKLREIWVSRTFDQIPEPHQIVDLPPSMLTDPAISTRSVWLYCWRQDVLVRVLWGSLVVVVKIVAGHDAWISIRPWQHKRYCHLDVKLQDTMNFFVLCRSVMHLVTKHPSVCLSVYLFGYPILFLPNDAL
jgi:hypothetical protein